MEERWLDLLFGIAQSLIVAGITSIIVIFFTKKYYSKLAFAKKIKDYGFLQSVNTTGLREKEKRDIFLKAERIRIIYVSGRNFFSNDCNSALIMQALEKGKKIQFLCATENSEFLSDIEKLEIAQGYRKEGERITDEITKIKELFSRFINFEIRQYNTEYRLPMILADYKNNNGEIIYKTWLTVTLPPYKSKESFLLRGQMNASQNDEETSDLNFIEMMNTHFDALWESAK